MNEYQEIYNVSLKTTQLLNNFISVLALSMAIFCLSLLFIKISINGAFSVEILGSVGCLSGILWCVYGTGVNRIE